MLGAELRQHRHRLCFTPSGWRKVSALGIPFGSPLNQTNDHILLSAVYYWLAAYQWNRYFIQLSILLFNLYAVALKSAGCGLHYQLYFIVSGMINWSPWNCNVDLKLIIAGNVCYHSNSSEYLRNSVWYSSDCCNYFRKKAWRQSLDTGRLLF